MSNDLVSQQLSIQSSQMGQLEPKLDSSMQMGFMGLGTSSLQQMTMSNMGVGLLGPGYNASASQQMSLSNMQVGMLQPVSNNPGSQMLPDQQTGQMESQTFQQQYFLPDRQLGELGTMSNNLELQLLSSSNKRKASMERSALQKAWMSNKRVAHVEHRPWLQQMSASEKRSVQQLQFLPISPGSQVPQAPNKKVAQRESVSIKSGSQKQVMAKSQNPHIQSSKKVQTESFESVRFKMRENLAAALALVSQDKFSNAEKSSQREAASSPGKTEGDSQPDGSVPAASDTVAPLSEQSKETLLSKNSAATCLDGQSSSSQLNLSNGNLSADMQATKCNVQDFPYGNLLPDEDVSFGDNFFARDELLQGNGLSWVLESEVEVAEKKETPIAEKQGLGNEKPDGDGGEQKSAQCPQILASKIEAELFKLFGGVNKKYKEKGRSLLFNLKDRNNPELRERVMSGEIPPERLCSMSAEELASKELSQWRMAKAEELAQMVVLPDSEVDIRRLVKKTHKGEFQVEVEQVDTASADLSVGVNSLSQTSEKVNETEASTPLKPGVKKESRAAAAEKKSNVEDQDGPCTITIPSSEGSDLMQGLMVENELKDSDLPPIVSLDEFMESLDSEPPFENLPGDAEKSTPTSDKDNSEGGSESKPLVQTTQDPADAAPAKHDKVDVSDTKYDADVKPSDSPVKSETAASVTSKGEVVWDGLLQLNISSTASVMGIFKSGEKTTGKEWTSFLEIKGRVKLDAFEKYLQELPMSRSRVVMILHFVGKEASPTSDGKSLSEVAESYVLDGRVGIAEPGPGVELYFCPPRSKSIELLSKILPQYQLEAFNAIDNGLIGVVVWKKAQLTSTVSPNSASHHKHASKKHFTSTTTASSSRRHHDKDHSTNMNTSIAPRPSMPHSRPAVCAKPPADDGEDDDVPPGFGPGVTQDDDDLPEFKFSGGSSHNPLRGPSVTPFHPPQTPSRPVDQIRELIHKYGQTQSIASSDRRGVGVATQPWNDDDDDIPEWQPQAPPQPVLSYQRAHMVNQQHIGLMQQSHQQFRQPAVPLQPQMNAMQAQQQNSWTQGPYITPSQPSGVKYYGQPGAAWRQDVPKSRGF